MCNKYIINIKLKIWSRKEKTEILAKNVLKEVIAVTLIPTAICKTKPNEAESLRYR